MNSVLKASTLAEMLVVMIVAGVVFMTVTDGVVLLGRHIASVGRTIADNGRTYEGYRNLENIVALADSVVEHDGAMLIYRDGEPQRSITLKDSILLAGTPGRDGWRQGQADTLLDHVTRLYAHRAREFAGAVDTLLVDLQTNDGRTLTLSFVPVANPEKLTDNLIEETETHYNYE